MRTDDELLDLLGRGLRPATPPEPTLREFMALEEAVRFPREAPSRRFRPNVNRQTVAALLGAGILATSGTAYAFEQGHVPDPVRAVAHAVGLPVESTGEHDARLAAQRLRDALSQGNDASVRAAAAALQARVRHLPSDDRRTVAEPLLADARQRLDAHDDAGPARHDGPPIEDAVNQGTIPARDDRGDGAAPHPDDRGDTRGPADASQTGGNGGSNPSTSHRPDQGSGRDPGSSTDHPTTATTTTGGTVRSGSVDHGDTGPDLRHDGLPDLGKIRVGRN